jgi:hypothetical protein
MADLSITVDVREIDAGNFQTMSSYTIPNSQKVKFTNASMTENLVISLKKGAGDPLCENNQPVKFPITIPRNGDRTMHVCKTFDGDEFLYTAQIGQADPEDPIVIIEKTKSFMLTPLTSALIAAAIGAAITYLIMRSRAGRMRPQQG